MRFFLFIFPLLFLLSSCCGDCDYQPRDYIGIQTSPIYEKNNTLYFSFISKYDPDETKTQELKIYKLSSQNRWEFSIKTIKKPSIEQEGVFDINDTSKVTFLDNKVVLKENDRVVFEDTLPTNEDILTNINLIQDNNYSIAWSPFLTKQYSWDKKSYVVSLAHIINKVDEYTVKTKLTYVYIFKEENSWHYQKIENKYSDVIYFNKEGTMNRVTIPNRSLDGRANLCFFALVIDNDTLKDRCFILENETMFLKDLFGEIYAKEYKNILTKTYSNCCQKNYTFDEDGNMHLFYNKPQEVENNQHQYFWYEYFTKENPTTPLYEQKIVWEE